MSLWIHSNELEGREAEPKSLEQIQEEVMEFLRVEAGFAQVFTISRDGFPVGRTMGAPIGDDWSVCLIQRRVHKRLGQLRRNPKIEIVWVGSPSGVSVNDRPHVYDFGLEAPRVVFLRGLAEFMSPDATWNLYEQQTALLRAKGQLLAPVRTRANVDEGLLGVLIRPIRLRAEGFGAGAESYTWQPGQGA